MQRTFLGHLETGRKDFRLTTIIRVAQSLGVTMQDLFTGLEAGDPFKSKRVARQVDTAALRRELTALERSVENLKEITLRQSHQTKMEKRTQWWLRVGCARG